MTLRSCLFAAVCAAPLAGCGEDPPPPPVVRPVLSVVAEPADAKRIGFAGVVEPRYQTDRAFQVLGRIISRNVDVGDLVKVGQTIATNDPLTYQLAVRSAQSEVVTAKSQLEKTSAQKDRTQTLVKQGVYTQADLDAAQQALDAAAASVQQAEARFAKAKEQLGYTTLAADLDGVVTAVYAEVGQMASPGMRVMTLARTDIREAVVDVPDDVAQALAPGAPFRVALQADPTVVADGKVREIAPEADAATRLRRIKITLERPQEAFRLGATIFAAPQRPTGDPSIELPTTSVFERDGAPRVWIVDKNGKTVRSVGVEIAHRDARIVRLSGGVPAGERVVIAGANSLSEGQAVKLGAGE
ncbi:efflux RND transporter periplasmic adaptor subunit [Chenggangzhangella methanolivorans]|uniref:Efflux RND transporter periplasmic adaptor subunit n=1 Tax=Chenggangzhangella methanolivorans TaxID=1437009 RepID=A0A9E6UP35_9HYPH|nr:efflux RND transporter periplasmic adaptor subunit [Chenggangzhangella methanolivorans]QZO01831.1 efflux RND transporter periplasmic adaptor subunit [Chenggangzhangella methanolivorans]